MLLKINKTITGALRLLSAGGVMLWDSHFVTYEEYAHPYTTLKILQAH